MSETFQRINSDMATALLKEGKEEKLAHIFESMHPADVAEVINSVDIEEGKKMFSLLSVDQASDVILELNEDRRKAIIEELFPRRLINLVDRMESDDAADFIGELPENTAKKVLESTPKAFAQRVQKLLKHNPDTAGGLMQAEFVAVSEDDTVEEVIETIRKKSFEVEDLHNIFVVDKDGKLVGILPIRRLVLANPLQKVKYIMDNRFYAIKADTDQEEVVNIFKRYDEVSMPVVDEEGRLLGRITIDDVMDVMEEEATEDIYKMAGLETEDHITSPIHRSFRIRFPWLLVNLITAFLAASIVSLFQNTIKKWVMLAVFMPVVAGMGGNAATQTLAVIVRSIAIGELTVKQARKAIAREVALGLLQGIAFGVITGFIAYLWGKSPLLGIITFFAMVVDLVVAGFGASIIPLVLKWLNVDPAIASTIFITTLTDCFGFFSMLGIAYIFLTYFGLAA